MFTSLRSLMALLTLVALVVGTAWLWSIGPPPGSTPQAPAEPRPAESPQDHRIEGDGRVVVRLSPLEKAMGFEESGGNLVDIEIDGRDIGFGSMTTFLDREFPRQGKYDQLLVLPEGGLRSLGRDSGNEHITVQTDWHLTPGEGRGVLAQLRIKTTVRNEGEDPVLDYELGDIIAWGELEHFAPGPGLKLAGVDQPIDWLGASNRRAALLIASSRRLSGPHGSSWSDPVYRSVDLLPGETDVMERTLFIGERLGDLVGSALAGLGRSSTTLHARVEEELSGTAVPGSTLVISRRSPQGKWEPIARTRMGDQGGARIAVEPGVLLLEASAPDRRSLDPVEVSVGHQPAVPAVLRLSGAGRLGLDVRDESGTPLPARADFRGVPPTPDPNFGPPTELLGRHRAYFDGSTEVPLPPGTYKVTITHGPTWSFAEEELRVPPSRPGSKPVALSITLRALVPELSEDWWACDFHQHSRYSPDSAVNPQAGLLASAAEGLDCVATTEHDVAVDWTPLLETTPLPPGFVWLPGIEVTSEVVGHFNAFPWKPSLGALPHRGKSAAEVVQDMRTEAPEAIVQLNHPLWGRNGMWKRSGFDELGMPRSTDDDGQPTGVATDFDQVELVNGKDVPHAEKTISAWLRMMAASGGKAPAPAGNSDSHRLVGQERGSSRTWLHSCKKPKSSNSSDVVAALKEGCRRVATNGPFLDLQATDGDAVTVSLTAPGWMPVSRVELWGGTANPGGPIRLAHWSLPSPKEAAEARRWTGQFQPSPDQEITWLVGIARGDEQMLPWSDTTALAVTGALPLD